VISPYRVLDRKRSGSRLSEDEIREVVGAAVDGSWSDAQLAAFLMASAIRGLDEDETRMLTSAMLESGSQWALSRDFPDLGDKHSTGGVGDKVSLILSPILAACDQQIVMLTGRGLGHTGGTADKLECIPGLDLELDRLRCGGLLEEHGMAIGVATDAIAPADRKLYALRDQTATVESIPLITASILSKKLATGAAVLVFDVKVGNGAFLRQLDEARELARSLVRTSAALGCRSSALITDMSQPLGDWVGHHSEVRETLDCLETSGPQDLMDVVFALCEEVARMAGSPLSRSLLEEAVRSGRARHRFGEWVEAQGGDAAWLDAEIPLAPEEVVFEASRAGYLAEVDTRRIGLLLAEAGGGRVRPGDRIDPGVALRYGARLGQRLEAQEEIARVYLRSRNGAVERELGSCFRVESEVAGAPPRVVERLTANS
jgi:pyrimidine-nucleoside phosphorylase